MKALNKETAPKTQRPERIIQFGEGNFLRAFVDWIIYNMNQKTDFNSSVVVVQPIDKGMVDMLNAQDDLYHVNLQGLDKGEVVNSLTMIDVISRALNPYSQNDEFMKLAEQPEMRFVISNTTEAGIAFDPSCKLEDAPASSYPGKLTQLLYHRFKTFNGDKTKGLIIFPCELIFLNGHKLKETIYQYIELWNLGNEFKTWFEEACGVYATLVDRIVPGFPRKDIAAIKEKLQYDDNLVVQAEIFHLWVIEAPQEIAKEFPADKAGLNVLFVPSEAPYHERKVTLLNGPHTVLSPVAYLSGVNIVREACEHEVIGKYIHKVMFDELMETLNLPKDELEKFANDVLERFNFPWKPLDEDFRPDLIVGSICTEGNTPPSEESNIMDQAFMLAMHDTDYTLPEERSVTIRRAVGVNMLDFDQAEAIMNAGYEDAVAAMPQLLEKVAERRDSAYYAGRREAFRAKCPPLVFDDYKLEGLKRAQREYIRDFVQVDRRTPGIQRPMGFEELKDNLFEVLAGGDFTMDFPTVRYDSVRERYSFEAKFGTRPNFKIILGGNISSTAFNQAYIGINYKNIGRVAQQLGADLYLGPIYTWGAIGGRTDFYAWKPIFLDYSYNFAVRNFRHGYFGNVTKVRNAQQVKNSESFFSTGVGMPLTHRSLLTLRANAGHINYRYDSDVLFADDTDHSRFSFFGLRAGVARNTLDKFLYPRRGSELHLSAIYVAGRDKYQPYDAKDFISRETRQWIGGFVQSNIEIYL